MNNLSLENFSSLLKKWPPRKIVRSEMITETITTYQFLPENTIFLEGGALANKIQDFKLKYSLLYKYSVPEKPQEVRRNWRAKRGIFSDF